jgi:hypothetical protein
MTSLRDHLEHALILTCSRCGERGVYPNSANPNNPAVVTRFEAEGWRLVYGLLDNGNVVLPTTNAVNSTNVPRVLCPTCVTDLNGGNR